MITTTIKGMELQFRTESSLFSPRRIDKGTLALLSAVEFDEEDRFVIWAAAMGLSG